MNIKYNSQIKLDSVLLVYFDKKMQKHSLYDVEIRNLKIYMY